jgi:GNAT superfamily N-acetyltransferase
MSRLRRPPLDFDGEPMPIETFRGLFRVPGFKYEYSRGRADISVQRSAHPVVAATPERILERTEPSLPADVDADEASTASVDALRTLWVNTLLRTPDYRGWAVDDVRADAEDSLTELFGDSEALHPASLVARWKGTLVGALLVTEEKTRPLIDVLFVRRDLRRRGVARALVHRVAHRLNEDDASTLCSGYLIANSGSAAWHEAVGFVELPDWLVTTHRYRCVQHNVKHRLVRDVFGAKERLRALKRRRAAMREERKHDPEAYSPSRWLRVEGARIDAHLDEIEAEASASGATL